MKSIAMNRGATTPNANVPSARWAWSHRPALVVFILTTLVVLAADLILKYWAFANVAGFPVVITEQTLRNPGAFWRDHAHEPIVLVPKLLSLHLMTNLGAVFGLGAGGRWFFIIVSMAAVVAIPWFFARTESHQKVLHLALALIMAGAMGNLYDRIVYGCVRDMLWLFPDWGFWPWIFNLADASLMVGVATVLLVTWFTPPAGSTAVTSPVNKTAPKH